MNILNSRSLISLCLFFTLGILPTLSQHKASASPGLADDCLPPGNRSVAVGADAMQFKKQPLRFEINRGQADAQVRFIARTNDSTLFLTRNEAVLHLPKLAPQPEPQLAVRKVRKAIFEEISKPIESAAIRLRPVSSNPQPRITGIDKLPGVSNYFIGNDPRKWRTNIESYAKVEYENVYPGIDLIYYGNDAGEIEYDFKVAVGANPEVIAMSIEGADRVELDKESGGLILHTSVGRVRQQAPFIYQEVNGARQEIAGRYKLLDSPSTASNSKQSVSLSAIRNPIQRTALTAIRNQRLVAFEVDDYDKSKPLVIDPVVVYATLLGGAAGNFDGARDVAVDAQGNAYMVGVAESSDFPTRNALNGVPPQRFASKAFIAKFAPDGTLIYSTFLGSADGSSSAAAIAVDATGAIYVAGVANPGFPIVNAFQPTADSFSDAFLTKLNAAGTAIIHSSFLGGNQGENVRDLKLDAQNNVYLLGEIPGRGAASVTFPTVNPTQANYGGGDRDVFFSIIDQSGSSLAFSTYFGGDGDDQLDSFFIAPWGDFYIAGRSDSKGFVTGCTGDDACGFVVRFTRASQTVAGTIEPQLLALIIPDLPKSTNPFPFSSSGSGEQLGFVCKGCPNSESVNVVGSGCFKLPPDNRARCTTFVSAFDQTLNSNKLIDLGDSTAFYVGAIAVDTRSALYITGSAGRGVSTVNPIQANNAGSDDVFVAVLTPDTFQTVFATYLGGDGFETPTGIAVDAQGNIYVSGIVTIGTTFPTTTGAFQRDLKGRNDAFLVKYSPVEIPTGPDFSFSFSQSSVTTPFGKVKVAADINRTGGFTGNVTITPATPLPRGIVLVGESVSTTENRVNFKLKVKASTALGTHQLSFAARDASGKTRTATLTLVVQ